MSFKPYTEKIKKKKIGIGWIRIRIKMIRIRNTVQNISTLKNQPLPITTSRDKCEGHNSFSLV